MKQLFLFLALGAITQQLSAREVINVNDCWEFQRIGTVQHRSEVKNQGSDWSSQFNVQHVKVESGHDSMGADGLMTEYNAMPAATWEQVTLPHTAYTEPLVIVNPWQGVCYYRRRIATQKQWAGKELWLEFEGAMHLADVWVDGKHVMRHPGGYTPFVVNLTDLVTPGNECEVIVRLDNRDNPLIPPGKALGELDFCYHSGLYRDVRLIVKDALHITHPVMADEVAGGGIFVTYPEVSTKRARIAVKTHVANNSDRQRNLSVRHTLYEWNGKRGKKVQQTKQPLALGQNEATHQQQELTVMQPRLWHPDSPSLYLLRTELREGGKVVDSEETRIGVRRIEMSREHGFRINGEPVWLEGTNRHQDYPYVGNAISDNAHYRDIYQIRNNGFNTVRLGHYPQDPSVLAACDELGLMVIEPIPGWQFYNDNDEFKQRTYKDIRDLIRRDRNHPSVIIWETTLNESWPPAEWKDSAVMVAHSEYPGDQCFTSGDSYGYDGFDVCYNDWEAGFNRPNHTQKPAFIREYYDYEFGGHYSTTRKARRDGDKGLMQNLWNAQWSHNRYRAYYPHTMGAAVWSMYDYNRGCCDNICYSGVADMFRLPKFSLPYFRTQLAAGAYTPAGPMPHELFIASHWMEGAPDTVMVYGNVDEVELLLNGNKIGRQLADAAPSTDYISQPDGGNATNLAFPPFTFTGVKWQAGTLEAVGYSGGREVARQTVRTPADEAAAISISYFESGQPAGKNDVLIVYASLTDANGTLCFGNNSSEITLGVIKGGRLLSPQTVQAEGGIASFIVATDSTRSLHLQASAAPNANGTALTANKQLKLK